MHTFDNANHRKFHDVSKYSKMQPITSYQRFGITPVQNNAVVHETSLSVAFQNFLR